MTRHAISMPATDSINVIHSAFPRVGGWEAGLGTFDLSGMTVAIIPDLGIARVRSEVSDQVTAAAEHLAEVAGLRVVEVVPTLASFTRPMGHGRPGWLRGRPRERISGSDSGALTGDADGTRRRDGAVHPRKGRVH